MNYAPLGPADSCVVCNSGPCTGCKFHWLLGLYALHPTGTPSDPSSTCHASRS